VSFWSYEHMDDEMWRAVSDSDSEGREDLQSPAYRELSHSLAELTVRVERLEAQVGVLGGPAAAATVPVSHTVRPGDTLAAIAAGLGLPDWRVLYEANREVTGGDPNQIRPGQTLVVPALSPPGTG
jgi:nucleoid-associated protein YgaU